MLEPAPIANAPAISKEQSGQLGGRPIWGRYGFVDAFNPNTGWVDTDVRGINLGATLLSAGNPRCGNVWR
ncbi:MAG: glucoamylase family protein [Terriglobia bacterium]